MFLWLQLQYGKDEDLKDRVEIVAILSMSDKEIDDALEIVSDDFEFLISYSYGTGTGIWVESYNLDSECCMVKACAYLCRQYLSIDDFGEFDEFSKSFLLLACVLTCLSLNEYWLIDWFIVAVYSVFTQ